MYLFIVISSLDGDLIGEGIARNSLESPRHAPSMCGTAQARPAPHGTIAAAAQESWCAQSSCGLGGQRYAERLCACESPEGKAFSLRPTGLLSRVAGSR